MTHFQEQMCLLCYKFSHTLSALAIQYPLIVNIIKLFYRHSLHLVKPLQRSVHQFISVHATKPRYCSELRNWSEFCFGGEVNLHKVQLQRMVVNCLDSADVWGIERAGESKMEQSYRVSFVTTFNFIHFCEKELPYILFFISVLSSK